MSIDPKIRDRMFSGLVLIVIGGLFLLDEFYYLRLDRWWPLILIGIGLWKLYTKKLGIAILLIALGVVFQADQLGYFYWDEIEQFWPLILIGVGVWLLLKSRFESPPNASISESDKSE